MDEEHFRAPLIWLAGPYLAGLVAACAGWGGASLLLAAGATAFSLAAIALAATRREIFRPLWALALAGGAFAGGMVWMHHALAPQPRWRALPPREAVLEVEVERVFAAADGVSRRSCLGRIVSAPPVVADLADQRVSFSAEPAAGSEFTPTMRVRLRGVLHPLEAEHPGPGGFEAYLVSNAIRFKLARAIVDEVTRGPAPLPRAWQALGHRFERILRHGLPEGHPATGAYVAMFLGRKSELAPEQREAFLRSGTMHLFAISGLHIGAIAYCLHTLLGILRVPRRAGMVIGLLLLAAFVEATGGAPSARRALFMVGMLWAGQALRRPANPLAALVASALGVLVIDPRALLSTSFQLSYSVVAAILLYGAPLRLRWLARWRPFRLVPERDWRWRQRAVFAGGRSVITLLAVSVAASLVSLPLGLGVFGLGSPGSVLSNVVLIPAAGVAVTAGFASLACGLLGALPLSLVFNHAAALILSAIAAGAGAASRVPGMFFHGFFAASWVAPAIVLTVLVLCLGGYARRWRRPAHALWLPPAVVGAAVVLLVTPGQRGQESAAMKSAYELAMERLKKADPDASPTLSAEQKERLAEIDRVYKGRIAEREIFLNQRLAEAVAAGQHEEAEKIRSQIKHERARLEEEREDEKNRVRRQFGAA